ncbi:MAG: 3-methyl-2-oxobutanoate hydroxymethyltransferase [Vulcanimicrobiaceae bacterium]
MAKPDAKRRKITIRQLREMKEQRRPIVALGVYESVTASLADEIGIEILMTGPSGPMSLFARTSVAEISFEEQLTTLRAVSRVTRYALINAHMPFLSYQTSERDAILNAGRLVAEGGADTVKCDAAAPFVRNIRAIVEAGIPVIAHIGVQASRRVEQSGFGIKGATADEAKRIIDDAHVIAEAGVFAFLVEHVCAEVMTILTQTLPVPVISLGSGGESDGACIVSGDLLNYSAFPAPAHAGRMVDLRVLIQTGLAGYASGVRARTYPDTSDAPHMNSREHEAFLQLNGRGT